MPAMWRYSDFVARRGSCVTAAPVAFSLMLALLIAPQSVCAAPRTSAHSPSDIALSANAPLNSIVHPRVQRAFNISGDELHKLMQFGYLPESDRNANTAMDESQLEAAIRQFQRYAHIPETGVIDETTRKQFKKPRCGLPDIQTGQRHYEQYPLQGETQFKPDLTWTSTSNTKEMNHTTTTTTKRPAEALPDVCNISYDAISVIRGEIFIFYGQYLWRINHYPVTHKPVAMRIVDFWYGLPENMTNIDAVYQRPHDHKIVIFIGRNYWVFNGNAPEPGYPQPLTTLGLPGSLDSIDAAMVWDSNGKTYFFKNDLYWRFDESLGEVSLDYPRDMSVWPGVPTHLDAAFQYRGITYFFKGRQFWRFIDRMMRVRSKVPSLSSAKWMGCPW